MAGLRLTNAGWQNVIANIELFSIPVLKSYLSGELTLFSELTGSFRKDATTLSNGSNYSLRNPIDLEAWKVEHEASGMRRSCVWSLPL